MIGIYGVYLCLTVADKHRKAGTAHALDDIRQLAAPETVLSAQAAAVDRYHSGYCKINRRIERLRSHLGAAREYLAHSLAQQLSYSCRKAGAWIHLQQRPVELDIFLYHSGNYAKDKARVARIAALLKLTHGSVKVGGYSVFDILDYLIDSAIVVIYCFSVDYCAFCYVLYRYAVDILFGQQLGKGAANGFLCLNNAQIGMIARRSHYLSSFCRQADVVLKKYGCGR